ncbi:cyclic nucleotide-binding protein, partial [Enterococcus mundtii]|nr:cyclic nucleotide-binding protein [Enterococcus mundtii]
MKQSKNKQVVIGESTKKNIYLQDIEQETQAFILQNNPQLTAESMITLAELLNYRLDYMKQLVANDSEKIQQLNELVVQHIKEDKLISNNMNEKMEKKLTFGQRAADTIAKFGGSWVFIGFFCFVLIAWIVINSPTLLGQPF